MDQSAARVISVVLPKQKTAESAEPGSPSYIDAVNAVLGIEDASASSFAEALPFSLNDTTAGCENEFQTAIIGKRCYVDLPITIEESNYYQNIKKRAKRGDTSRKAVVALDHYLHDNGREVWENSWVRFPQSVLGHYALSVFRHDLLADKQRKGGSLRDDAEKFTFHKNGEPFIRIPVSYLLKLALADSIGINAPPQGIVFSTGREIMGNFSNDNTSPEIHSFAPVLLNKNSRIGHGLAVENAIRFLLAQFLIMYANNRFQLSSLDQRTMLYFAPHPPVRQKKLNDIISDSFYRELFMNPCLSGWNRGQEKYRYMELCHRVLSRSQLNAVIKLKEAGIITTNVE